MAVNILTDYLSKIPYTQKQEVREPFQGDLLAELMAIGVRPTVEEMTYRMLCSIGTLCENKDNGFQVDTQHSFMFRVRGNVHQVDFMSNGQVIATVSKEPDVIWKVYDKIDKKVTLVRQNWPGWPYAQGTPEESYKYMLQRIGAFEKAYKNALA